MTPPHQDSEADGSDGDAGPVVRPYAVTGGRARPAGGNFDLISLVMATPTSAHHGSELGPEHLTIVNLCQQVLSVAEISSHLNLPLGTVRVLLGDLLVRKLVTVWEPQPVVTHDDHILEAVLDGLRAL